MQQNYFISDKQEDMDLDIIHGFLSRSYWSPNIPRKTVQSAINNSLCFGVFTRDGEQVGFARMITDKTTFAYLADVFVLEAHREKGLSKALMTYITEHSELQGLRRMSLATRDAHGLYQKFGFTPLSQPELFMERWRPDIYVSA